MLALGEVTLNVTSPPPQPPLSGSLALILLLTHSPSCFALNPSNQTTSSFPGIPFHCRPPSPPIVGPALFHHPHIPGPFPDPAPPTTAPLRSVPLVRYPLLRLLVPLQLTRRVSQLEFPSPLRVLPRGLSRGWRQPKRCTGMCVCVCVWFGLVWWAFLLTRV